MIYKLIKQSLFSISVLCTSVLTAAPLTPNELHATMGIVTNFILSDDNIRFHGKNYQPVTSPHTGRVWLDRNIGANKKCASFEDAQCYGDYFQWGRKYDGHQSSVDSTTVLASNINNAGAEYIRGAADWASTDLSYGNARATNWLKTDGSNVCPVGYRVPLRSELDAEVGNISNKETAYANFLKLPAAGYRGYGSANYYSAGTWGTVWSVTSTASRASYFSFSSISTWDDSGKRGYGMSVRCIKHVGKPLIYHNTTTYGTVTSPYTGKIWLDRNLGASQICTSSTDALCYGDLYQWGRYADGHQGRTSGQTAVNALSAAINVGHGNFIPSNTTDWLAAGVDNDGSIRSANWSAIDGTSVCPVGYRVPTYIELETERLSWSSSDAAGALTSALKMPMSGYRYRADGTLGSVGTNGFYWSSVPNGTLSRSLGFSAAVANTINYYRSNGFSVRCIKD